MISSVVSPFAANAPRNAPACACVHSPSTIAPTASSIASASRSSRRTMVRSSAGASPIPARATPTHNLDEVPGQRRPRIGKNRLRVELYAVNRQRPVRNALDDALAARDDAQLVRWIFDAERVI